MPAGKIEWFDVDKGFGYIQAENGDEIVVHHDSFKHQEGQQPQPGAWVQFDIIEGEKGRTAVNITAYGGTHGPGVCE